MKCHDASRKYTMQSDVQQNLRYKMYLEILLDNQRRLSSQRPLFMMEFQICKHETTKIFLMRYFLTFPSHVYGDKVGYLEHDIWKFSGCVCGSNSDIFSKTLGLLLSHNIDNFTRSRCFCPNTDGGGCHARC